MKQELDMTRFFPEVLQVVPTDDFEIYAYFNDGLIRLFDVKPLIKDGTVFEPLKDIAVFKDTLTVLNHTVAWDLEGNRDTAKCIDLDPDVIFAQPIVPDPLS
jgi:hypothetical protein